MNKDFTLLEIIKKHCKFILVGNCLQIYVPFYQKYVFIAEIEDEQEYDLLKEVLL